MPAVDRRWRIPAIVGRIAKERGGPDGCRSWHLPSPPGCGCGETSHGSGLRNKRSYDWRAAGDAEVGFGDADLADHLPVFGTEAGGVHAPGGRPVVETRG